MPYASKKQQKYFHTKEGMKKVGMKVVKEFDKESKGKSIPKKLKK
jgi:hypothetical protein